MKTTTRTWIGGGNNQASNPNDWADPNGQPGVPRRGDSLIMNGGTINIHDNDLKGDTLTVGFSLSGQIPPVINLTNANAKLQGSSALPGVRFTLNAGGNDTLTMVDPTNSGVLVSPTINLADNAHLLMKGEMHFAGGYDINGAPGSEIINKGTIVAGRVTAPHSINTDIAGHGTIEINPATTGPSFYTINGAVGRGQILELASTPLYPPTVDIKQPDAFRGLIDVPAPSGPPFFLTGSFVLEGVTATSYSVKGDRLSLFDGHKNVDTVRLRNPTDQPLSVGQSGSNIVLAINEPAPGNILPMHGFV